MDLGVWRECQTFQSLLNGGRVLTTKTNFLIALAPYFFPFYAVVIVALFIVGDLIWGWRRTYQPWFHLLLGAAYAFHLTLTWEILKTRQTDITSQGYLFSGVIIFLGNALVLAVAVPLLTGHGLLDACKWWVQCNAEVLQKLARLL